MRKGAADSTKATGIIEKKISSNNLVKSKPPRQEFPAQGPNVPSTDAQF
jgi:hypothetical protein